MCAAPRPRSLLALPTLCVHTPDGRTLRFTRPFNIGRGEECDVRVTDRNVSRTHVAVSFGNEHWWLRDAGSSNGVLVEGERIESASIDDRLAIQLGKGGPILELALESMAVHPPEKARRLARGRAEAAGQPAVPADVRRYFDDTAGDEPVGDRTMMIRQAYQALRSRQQRRHTAVVAALALAGIAVAAYAYVGYRRIGAQTVLAQQLFYAMKAQDVDIARAETAVAASGSGPGRAGIEAALARRRAMAANYETFLSGLRSDRKFTPREQLILRVTRIFGECDLVAPPQYLQEVSGYIERWRSTGRFERAVQLARSKGYTRPIVDELLGQNLAPQFFYLAMQESDFEPFRSGPDTYKGIAKGMWQFIPETGAKYGLRIGPLAQFGRPDPADDRHDWEKSTRAAARYIKDIYATDAQASGLLVIASYNWGEDRVVNLLRRMPANPKERNFWRVLEKHRDQVPDQTYDYVFYVVAAAVIGENPRLFGFDFDNPLGYLDSR